MRQRVIAQPIQGPAVAPVGIGVQLLRVGQQAQRAAATGGTAVSGPYIVEIGNYAGFACTWIVWMRGASSASWALTWDEMGDSPTAVEFDPAFDASDTVQIVRTNVTSTNIVVYATADGNSYASDPISCAI